ncbi:MAG: hypothetical protein ACE5H1_05990 [Thermodesulfobacteriota bacterium]
MFVIVDWYMQAIQYKIERLDELIAKGEIVLRSYNKKGNIDQHDLWFTEVHSFLVVNAPEFVEKFKSIAPKYRDALLVNAFGRAAYQLIQEQIEVLKEARGSFADSKGNIHAQNSKNDSTDFLEALELKPNIFGFGLNLNFIMKRLGLFLKSLRIKNKT